MPAIWKTQQWSQDWKRLVYIPVPKMFKLLHNVHISHASKVILKIVQAKLQQDVNQELADVQAGFRKDRGTRDQLPTFFGS